MKPAPLGTERGFTLLELSISLLIIAVVTGMAISTGVSVVATARQSATQSKMKVIEQALMQFRTANDRLPCPGDLTLAPGSVNYGLEAGRGTGASIAGNNVCTIPSTLPKANFGANGATNTLAQAAEGALPAITLGLSPDFMVDGWGNKFRYVVDTSMTTNGAFVSIPAGCIDGAITVNDANGNARSSNSIYALISSGANGHGAYTKNGVITNAGSTNTNEQTNCHCNSSATATTYAPTYVQQAPYLDPTTATDTFDDLVTYKERWQMQTTWDTMGRCQYAYTIDVGGNRIEVLNLSGTYLYQLGNCTSGPCSGGSGNGAISQADDVKVDSSGNVWLTDYNNNRVEEFNSSGSYVQKFGSYGAANGQFATPMGIAIDSSGNVWVADSENNRVQKFNSTGTWLLTIPSGCANSTIPACAAGTTNGTFQSSSGISVIGIAADSSGNVWVADKYNNRVQEFNSSGSYVTQLGCTTGACTAGSGNGQLHFPSFLTFDASGNLWVVDASNTRIEEFSNSGGTYSYASKFSISAQNDWVPGGIAFDPSGNIWVVADPGSSTAAILEYNTSGTYLTGYGTSGTGNGQYNVNSDAGIGVSGR